MKRNAHAGHQHTHTMAKQSLRLAFFLTLLILGAELIGGFLANSLALLSDAGHVITDIFALGLAWFATVQAERPANARKTFGYHRVGILAAFVNAVTLVLIAVAILWEAVQRLQHPQPVQPLIMFLAAGIGIIVNLYIGFGLRKEGENLNARAATLHVFGDAAVSAGVIVAGIIILITGWTIVDPLLSVGVSVLIAIGAWQILRETTDILMEAVPKGLSITALVDDMRRIQGVQDVHDIHVWSISGNMSALSCHVTIENLPPSESSSILQNLNSMLREKYHIGHATIQFECDAQSEQPCAINGLYCCLEAKDDTRCDEDSGELVSSSNDTLAARRRRIP